MRGVCPPLSCIIGIACIITRFPRWDYGGVGPRRRRRRRRRRRGGNNNASSRGGLEGAGEREGDAHDLICIDLVKRGKMMMPTNNNSDDAFNFFV